MIDANERKSMALADLLVAPDLAGLTSSDFAKFEEMEKRGYEAAEKKKALLQTLSVSEEEWRQYLAARQRKRLPKQITPSFVAVRGVDEARQKSIEADLKEMLDGQALTPGLIDESLTEIAGYGPYSSANYAFVKKDGVEGLQVNVQRKAYGQPVLDTGLNIEGSETANIRFGFGMRLTFMDFGGPNSEWRSDVTVGRNNSVATEYYRRLGQSRWFVAPRGFYSRSQEDVYTDNDRTSILKVVEGGAGADFGYAFSRFQEFRLGYQYNHIDRSVSSGVAIPWLTQAAAGLQSARFRWVYDAQDSPLVPRHGIHSILNAGWTFGVPSGTPQYGVLEERLQVGKSFGPRYTLIPALAGGTIAGPKSYLPPFSLGGPGAMSAFGLGQFRGDRYYYGGLHGLRAFSADRSSFFNKVHLDLGVEMGKAFTNIEQGMPAYDGLVGVVGETPLGIVFVGYSHGTAGNNRFFFRIGRMF
jgi:NTE family protein